MDDKERTKQIENLLTEEGFPHMLLLDGKWGSGKTYYIKKILLPELQKKETLVQQNNKEIVFLSLYGISSLNDFKDRLISTSFTGKNEAINFLDKIKPGIEKFTNMFEDSKGYGALIGAFSGPMKQAAFASLNHKIFILDDLERTSDEKTIKNILGECLNLVESKNIEIIVVANEDKILCKTDIEKVFADKIDFSRSTKEIIEILKNEYNCLNNLVIKNNLLNHITELKMTNLRVIKRTISKFEKLYKLIVEDNSLLQDQALSKTLSATIRICHAKYEHNFKSEDINKLSLTYMERFINQHTSEKNKISNKNKEKKQEEQEKSFDKIFSNLYNQDISQSLIDYCYKGIFVFNSSNIASKLELPKKEEPLSFMLTYSFVDIEKIEFDQGVEELTDFIFKDTDEKTNFNSWIRACDVYYYLIQNDYIKTDANELNLKLVSVTANKFEITLEEKDVLEFRGPNCVYEKIIEMYNRIKDDLNSNIKNKQYNDFNSLFCKSWANVENQANENLMFQPFFKELGVENFIKAVYSWPCIEVKNFEKYIHRKYNFSNIEEYFEQDHETLTTVITKLKHKIEDLDYGQRRGTLRTLQSTLVYCITKMNDRIALKNQNTER